MAIICALENGEDGWIRNSSEFGGVGARPYLEITTAGKPRDAYLDGDVDLGDLGVLALSPRAWR